MAKTLLIGDELMVVDSTEIPSEKTGHRVKIAGNGERTMAALSKLQHIDIPRGAKKIGVTDTPCGPIANDYQLSLGRRQRVASG